MQPSDYLISSLILMNVFQFWFWSRQLQTLVDKVMSKNYADYVHSTKKANEIPKKIILPNESEQEDDNVLDALNGMLRPGL